jgi:hypothetical protein
MSHQCPRNGCTRTVDDTRLLCGPDWKLVPDHLQRAVYAAYKRGKGLGSPQLAAAQDAAVRAVNGESEAAPRPTPYELWVQAAEDPDEYRRLLREHGHILRPGDEGYDPDAPRTLPCGWSPDGPREQKGPQS